MNEFIYKCPECSSTNLTFDISGATYDPIYRRFIAYVGQEGEAKCLDCDCTRLTAVKEEIDSEI